MELLAETLIITLRNGQAMSVPFGDIEWLRWLADATPEQRAKWSIEPGGFAIYWEELDDGIEIEHLRRLPMITMSDMDAVRRLEGV